MAIRLLTSVSEKSHLMNETPQPEPPDVDQVERASQQTFKKLREKVQELRAAEDLERRVKKGEPEPSQ